MVVIFKWNRETAKFVLFKSDDFKQVGDFSKVYARKDCELSEYKELVLISMYEYENLLKDKEVIDTMTDGEYEEFKERL